MITNMYDVSTKVTQARAILGLAREDFENADVPFLVILTHELLTEVENFLNEEV